MSEELTRIKAKALALLARREHSRHELRVKLTAHATRSNSLDEVLAELESQGYLNEQRYVEMMFRHHFARGCGPQKIIHELRQNGVAEALIRDELRAYAERWEAAAQLARHKRFGPWSGGDFKEQAKQMRFLASRGFTQEQIERAFILPGS